MEVPRKKACLEKHHIHRDLLLEIVQRLKSPQKVARCAILNKDCLSLWKELRNLKFVLPLRSRNLHRFTNIVEKCLTECINIRSFHLNMHEKHCSSDQLKTWGFKLQLQKVQAIDITMRFPVATIFPKEFNNSYLEHLVLKNSGVRPDGISIPFLNNMRKLVKLTMHNVALQPNQNKSTSCLLDIPTLKLLIMELCSHRGIEKFTVDCPKLEHLEVQNNMFSRCDTCFFTVNTPKLQSMKFNGLFYKEYCISNLEHLQSACFEFASVSIDEL